MNPPNILVLDILPFRYWSCRMVPPIQQQIDDNFINTADGTISISKELLRNSTQLFESKQGERYNGGV